MHVLLQTKAALRELKNIRSNRVICHLPDFCHYSRAAVQKDREYRRFELLAIV